MAENSGSEIKVTFCCPDCGETVNRKRTEPVPKKCPYCGMGEIVTKLGSA